MVTPGSKDGPLSDGSHYLKVSCYMLTPLLQVLFSREDEAKCHCVLGISSGALHKLLPGKLMKPVRTNRNNLLFCVI